MPKGNGSGSAAANNHANQCNPNHSSYQGASSGYSGAGTHADLSNHANQCNPNHSSYGKKA